MREPVLAGILCLRELENQTSTAGGGVLLCSFMANGRLLAALPMVLLRGRLRLWKHAVICGPEAAEGCDILIERTTESRAIAAALLCHFLLSACPDMVSFFFVKSGCHLDIAIRDIGLRFVVAFDNVMPYADLKTEADWASYKRSLSKHYESNIHRKTRRLQELRKITRTRSGDTDFDGRVASCKRENGQNGPTSGDTGSFPALSRVHHQAVCFRSAISGLCVETRRRADCGQISGYRLRLCQHHDDQLRRQI